MPNEAPLFEMQIVKLKVTEVMKVDSAAGN
jgi:hypothetical protein